MKNRGLDQTVPVVWLRALITEAGGQWPNGHGERSMRCPWHEDRHASAHVNTMRGVYYCHTCGTAGDAIKILEQTEGLGYVDAIRRLEGISGQASHVVIEERPGGGLFSRKRNKPRYRRQVPARWRPE